MPSAAETVFARTRLVGGVGAEGGKTFFDVGGVEAVVEFVGSVGEDFGFCAG
jgi:hypothetical protein